MIKVEKKNRYPDWDLFGVSAGCKGSKEIQGTWYAVNSDSRQMMIEVTDKTITFKMEGEEDLERDYTQTGAGFKNNTSYKLLKFDDTKYSFIFPNKKDKDKGVIIVPRGDNALDGDIYWVVSRKDYPK